MKTTSLLSSTAFFAVVSLLAGISVLAQAQGFVPKFTHEIQSIAVQPDGKAIVAAQFPNISRLNTDGTFDPTFSAPALVGNQIYPAAVALVDDGKILCFFYGTSGTRLYRLNNNGSLDTSFSSPQFDGPTYGGSITQIVPASNGQFYVVGVFNRIIGGLVSPSLMRFNADGSVDPTFVNTSAPAHVSDVLPLPDGKLIVIGTLETPENKNRVIIRLNADGSPDPSFIHPPIVPHTSDVHLNPSFRDIVQQPDGKLIAVGFFALNEGQYTHENIVRLNADGTHDPTFRLGPDDRQHRVLRTVLLQPDGKVLVGGAVIWNDPLVQFTPSTRAVRRFNPDGSRDVGFNRSMEIPFHHDVKVLALGQDGKIFAGGNFSTIVAINRLIRLDKDGRLDAPYARFEFNGDHMAELSIFRPSNNTWYMHTGSSYSTFQFGEENDLPAPADYDGDGKTDIAVFRQSNGTWYWINSGSFTFSYIQWGEPGDLPMPGAIINRAHSPLDIYRPSNSTWYRLFYENGVANIRIRQFGSPGDVPIPGAFRTRFNSSLTVFKPATRTFRIAEWDASVLETSEQYGQLGDLPVPGDYDGDALTDMAIYRPSTGLWIIRRRSDGALLQKTWGEPGDIPVTADYDGDQRDDIAVFRPSNGTWYIIGSTEGWRIQQFGQAGDLPIPSSYQFSE